MTEAPHLSNAAPEGDWADRMEQTVLDAALGLINIEQNAIIKIFSVAAVVFLPPTLVASIYGMNFEHMPELKQPWAYPIVICGLVISALIPIWWFKRKKLL